MSRSRYAPKHRKPPRWARAGQFRPAEVVDLVPDVIEAIDVPDGDYSTAAADALAHADAKERHHRRPRRRAREEWTWSSAKGLHATFAVETRICVRCRMMMSLGGHPVMKMGGDAKKYVYSCEHG